MSQINSNLAYEELQFMDELLGSRQQQYRQAFWLKSNFYDPVWYCGFGNRKVINFQIELPDKTQLTDEKNHILLETLKCFLCIQTHFDVTGNKKLSNCAAYSKVSRALHIIDYWLLNANDYCLASEGLANLSTNELTVLLHQILKHAYIEEGVYAWTVRISDFLKEKSKLITQDDIFRTVKKTPILSAFQTYKNKQLLLSKEELLAARVWLKMNFFYKAGQGRSHFRYVANTRKMSEIIFKNTLSGRGAAFRNFDELSIGEKKSSSREFPGVPTRTKNPYARSDRLANKYYAGLRSLGYLSNIGLPAPIESLNAINLQTIKMSLKLGQDGRFCSLPSRVVFLALRHSIEFSLTYGDLIVDAYLKLVGVAIKSNIPINRLNLITGDIQKHLPGKLREIGVQVWSLVDRYNLNEARGSDYFQRIRKNEGLHELIAILYGAVQLCVGTLMARRQSELCDLMAFDCLDKSEKYLIFYARKTGYDNKRVKMARPIPKVAVTLVKLLEKLQKGLMDQGILKRPRPLFSYPNLSAEGLTQSTSQLFNRNIDVFCDYFQLPLNKNGQRYYIRQHQLRRFFAMLFFWGNSFGGMDTLRWFLAHTDVEHLYHYITEDITGNVLKGIKAQYAAEQLQHLKAYDDSYRLLADIVEKHFGTRKFDILDTDHLTEYLEDLMKSGDVEIEPEFFETKDGEQYRILVKVIQKESK